MQTDKSNSVGDLWYQMDLHVHTPASAETRYGNREAGSTWEKFFSALRELGPKISVLGINDYWTVEGYQRVREEYDRGRLPDVKLLLPVVELRLTDVLRNGKRQNYHVCFSDEVSVEDIKNNFLGKLTCSYRFSDGNKVPFSYIDSNLVELGRRLVNEKTVPPPCDNPTDADLLKIGKQAFAVERDQIRDLLREEWFAGRTLEFVGFSETKQIDNIGFEGMEKRHLLQADGAFLASPNAEAFRNNQASLRAVRDDIPLIHGSDAHRFDDNVEITRHLGKSEMWVRCSPNFESLAFAISKFNHRLSYGEPDDYKRKMGLERNVIERISIEAPSEAAISFQYGFDINPGYTAVIGNRGQGKSALADWIAIPATTDSEIDFAFLNDHRFSRARKMEQAYKLKSFWSKGNVLQFGWVTGAKASCNRVDYFPQARIEQLCSADPNTDGSKRLERLVGDLLFKRIPALECRGATSLEELKNILRTDVSELLVPPNISNLEALQRSAKADIERIHEIRLLRLKHKRVELERKVLHLEAQRGVESGVEGNTKIPPIADAPTRLVLAGESEERWVHFLNTLETRINQIGRSEEVHCELEAVAGKWFDSLQFDSSEFIGLTYWNDSLNGHRVELEEGLNYLFSNLASAVEQMSWQLESLKQESVEILDVLRGVEAEVRDEIASNEKGDNDRKLLSQLKSGETDPGQDRWSLRGIDKLLQEEMLKLDSLNEIAKELASIASTSHKRNLEAARALSTLLNGTLEDLNLGEGSVTVEVKVADRFNFEKVEESIKVRGAERIGNICSTRKSFNDGFSNLAFDEIQDYMESVLRFILESYNEDLLKKTAAFVDNFDLLQCLTDFSTFDFRVELALDGRPLPELSPGQRGLVLLLFILEADESGNVLLIDQPEDNLDNDAIRRLLVPALERARLKRQVIVVTHNANIGVLGDPDQVVSCNYDGKTFSVFTGSIAETGMQAEMLRVLEGAEDAFRDRAQRYGLRF